MKPLPSTAAMAFSLVLSFAGRAAAEEDAAALLEKTGVKGGLCLVVGAKDTALAAALAARSTLYVQVLQPDAKLAADWGAGFAKQECLDREKLGVRNAAFNPDHYGSSLFNLVVVEDTEGLGKARLADVCRILVPNGFVALKSAPARVVGSSLHFFLFWTVNTLPPAPLFPPQSRRL